MEEFKEARYMQMLWPRDIWRAFLTSQCSWSLFMLIMHTARGVVMHKMRMRKKAFRDNHKQQLIEWVLEEQSRGVSPVVVVRINVSHWRYLRPTPCISLLGFRRCG